MNNIHIKCFQIVTVNDSKKADLILSQNDDITDFIAIGFVCLYKTISTPNETEIRIGYPEVKTLHSGVLYSIYPAMQAVLNYVYGTKQTHTLAVYMASAISQHVTGVNHSYKLAKLLPKEFHITDTQTAQKLAMSLTKNRVYEVTL